MAEYIRQIRGFRRDIKLFLLYNLFVNVGWGVFLLIFNLYLTALGLREDDIGAFSAAQTLSMAAAAASMGPLLHRFGIWRCITGGGGIFLVASYALAFAEEPKLLLVLSSLNGIGLAYLFTATMPFIIEWARRDQRQHVSAITFSTISLAATFGSLLGGFLPNLIPAGEVWQFRLTLVLGTLIATAGLLPLFLMGPARQGRAPVDPSEPAEREGPAARRQVRRDMAVFIVIGGLMAIGAGMVIPFYNVYLTTLGASAGEIGLVFALGGFSAAVVGLAAPAVARRFGSLWAVVVVRLAIVPFFALLIVAPTYALAVITHIVRQTSISMSWPIDSTFIAEVLPPRARATVFGLRSAAWNVGYSIASLVAGVLIVRVGYDLTFLDMIVFSILAMVVFAGYYARHPRIRAGEIPSALSPAARARLVRAAIAEEEARTAAGEVAVAGAAATGAAAAVAHPAGAAATARPDD